MDGEHLETYWTILKNWIEDEVGAEHREQCPALFMVEAALHTISKEGEARPQAATVFEHCRPGTVAGPAGRAGDELGARKAVLLLDDGAYRSDGG